MNIRFKCLSGLVFPHSDDIFQFLEKYRNNIGEGLGNSGGKA